MLKDFSIPKVENLALAIVPPEDANEELWDVLLINLEEEAIINVLVVSKGYGEMEGEKRITATMRYFLEQVGPLSVIKIEPIQPAVFQLANEYWVSFSFAGQMYDKKYVFVKGSIDEQHFTMIPFVGRKGVMIR